MVSCYHETVTRVAVAKKRLGERFSNISQELVATTVQVDCLSICLVKGIVWATIANNKNNSRCGVGENL